MNCSKRIKTVFWSVFVVAIFAAVRPWGIQVQDKDAKPVDKPAEAPAPPAPEESSVIATISLASSPNTLRWTLRSPDPSPQLSTLMFAKT
jgi:hypothetical protein